MSLPSLTFAFYLLLTSSLVLYVYRFAVLGVNLSAFRLLLLGWLGWLAFDLVRGRVRPERKYWPLVAMLVVLAALNVNDFLSLTGHGPLRRDIANHLLNLAFAALVTIYVDTESRRVAMLRAFVLSSVVTTAITAYSALTNRFPFDSLIRTLGSEHGRRLSYISDDTVIERATAAFYDPNFYGVYSLLVILAIVYLWLFAGRARWLAALFLVNLGCLALTLSRTAVIGVVAAMGLTFLMSRRSRVFAVASSVSAVLLLYAATTVQSHQARRELGEQAAAAWESWTADEGNDEAIADEAHPADMGSSTAPTAGAQARGSRRAPSGASRPGAAGRSMSELSEATSLATARVADGKSLQGRMEHIRQGLKVFREHPVAGGGSAALLVEGTGNSSAHVSYLTLLARHGIIGLLAYMAYLLYPLWVVWLRGASWAHRYFVTVTLGALLIVYLGYDILFFFEVQYLFFGLMYSIALEHADRAGSMAGDAA